MGKYFGNSGQAVPLLLVMLAVIGLIFFLFISNTFSFKDRILKDTFVKKYSKAFGADGTGSAKEAKTKLYKLFENQINPLSSFKKVNFNCVKNEYNAALELECEDAELESIDRFKGGSSFILSGSIYPKDENSSDFFEISLGIFEDDGQFKREILRAGVESLGNVFIYSYNGTDNSKTIVQKYNKNKLPIKIVFSNLEGRNFVYFYVKGSNDPLYKKEVEVYGSLGVNIKCKSVLQTCVIADLSASGEKVE